MSIAMTLDAKPAGVIPAMNANGALVAGENLLVALALVALALLRSPKSCCARFSASAFPVRRR